MVNSFAIHIIVLVINSLYLVYENKNYATKVVEYDAYTACNSILTNVNLLKRQAKALAKIRLQIKSLLAFLLH